MDAPTATNDELMQMRDDPARYFEKRANEAKAEAEAAWTLVNIAHGRQNSLDLIARATAIEADIRAGGGNLSGVGCPVASAASANARENKEETAKRAAMATRLQAIAEAWSVVPVPPVAIAAEDDDRSPADGAIEKAHARPEDANASCDTTANLEHAERAREEAHKALAAGELHAARDALERALLHCPLHEDELYDTLDNLAYEIESTVAAQ